MRPIMDSIRSYNSNLYFLDSLTTPRSVAQHVALNSGLDSERGSAIAIGHPHSPTIEFLAENLPALEESFNFMSVSKLIELINQPREVISWQENLSQLKKDLHH